MPETTMLLAHINMPARDPEGLARWYADTFGLQAKAHVVRGPGVLLAFVRGEPVNRPADVHIGLHVPSLSALQGWAKKFDAQVTPGAEFTTMRTQDPEGNGIEMYCNSEG
jgi:catechol-2,3-dioxygenase